CLLTLNGCVRPITRGNATGYEASGFMGRKGDRSVRIELPSVSLGKTSTHRFVVRGLTPAGYDYSMWMPLPRVSQEDAWNAPKRGRLPSWGGAVVSITVRDLAGNELEHTCYSLMDSIKGNVWSTDGVWKMQLLGLTKLPHLTDYELEISVIEPS